MRTHFGHYTLVAELGRGGMGVVYKGYEPSLNRNVAIKVLAESLANDARITERFQREARSMAALNDSHIIQIHFIGEEDGLPYFVMEFVDGESLGAMLKRVGKLKPEQAARLIRYTALGLATAHDKGVIHRDIKPGNLLISSTGQVKIADFGIALLAFDVTAKLTTTGEFVGTPGYLSPEVCHGNPADQRSDIFSLGIVFFECLSGRMPFSGDSPFETMRQLLETPAPDIATLNPDVDAELARVLAKMIAKDPAERYQNCHELIADLAKHPLIASGEPLQLDVHAAHGKPLRTPVTSTTLVAPSGGAAPRQVLSPAQSVTAAPVRRSKRLWIVAAMLALGLGSLWLFRDKLPLGRFGLIPAKSIAVLPLVNTSGDASNEYFSDGLSEELINTLGHLHELKVIGRTSSFQFKGKTVDSRTIGSQLGVRYLLEGSVRKIADRVRIAVELVQAADGAGVWSETYDRELKDVFAVQSEIATQVAGQLKLELLGNASGTPLLARTDAPPSRNTEAYQALLQGNFYYERRTADDTRKAMDYYEQAVLHDPHYALAYARLALAATDLATRFEIPSREEHDKVVARVREAAATALRLDPKLPEAHGAHGLILQLLDLDLGGADAELRRALELAPQDPGTLLLLGNLRANLGQLDEAIALLQRAVAVDPLWSRATYNLGLYLTARGRYDEAEAALRKSIELQPQASVYRAYFVVLQILQGNAAAAVDGARQMTSAPWNNFAQALAFAAHGDHKEADTALNKLIAEDADDGAFQIAAIYALRKEPDQVFKWLDHAWDTRDAGVAQLLWHPFLTSYQNDPRYVAFARKIGVMPAEKGTQVIK